MKFFGRRYSAPAYEDAEQGEALVGARCAHCGEPIAADDDGWMVPTINAAEALPFHAACQLRGIIGSVAHQQRRCSCFVPGSTCGDDPALTRRQAAEAAEKCFFGRQSI